MQDPRCLKNGGAELAYQATTRHSSHMRPDQIEDYNMLQVLLVKSLESI